MVYGEQRGPRLKGGQRKKILLELRSQIELLTSRPSAKSRRISSVCDTPRRRWIQKSGDFTYRARRRSLRFRKHILTAVTKNGRHLATYQDERPSEHTSFKEERPVAAKNDRPLGAASILAIRPLASPEIVEANGRKCFATKISVSAVRVRLYQPEALLRPQHTHRVPLFAGALGQFLSDFTRGQTVQLD
jgi:hypothetical protein